MCVGSLQQHSWFPVCDTGARRGNSIPPAVCRLAVRLGDHGVSLSRQQRFGWDALLIQWQWVQFWSSVTSLWWNDAPPTSPLRPNTAAEFRDVSVTSATSLQRSWESSLVLLIMRRDLCDTSVTTQLSAGWDRAAVTRPSTLFLIHTHHLWTAMISADELLVTSGQNFMSVTFRKTFDFNWTRVQYFLLEPDRQYNYYSMWKVFQ